MSRIPLRPFLIAKVNAGTLRITVRETRLNSQRYPIVTSTFQPETFKSATAARTFAKLHLGAEASQFASA